MEWIGPWWSVESQTHEFRDEFRKQLEFEVSPGHEMHGLAVRLIGRNNSNDDAVFQILDGSNRVAVVHLTWGKSPQSPPWPLTTVYANLSAFAEDCMLEYEKRSTEIKEVGQVD